jgi:hypothetical protein
MINLDAPYKFISNFNILNLYLQHNHKYETTNCGPTQLNIYFEGVSDHGDKQDLVFSGLCTFLKRRADSVDTVPRHCWQCLHALVGVTAHQTKIPSVAIITVNPRTEPTPPIIC